MALALQCRWFNLWNHIMVDIWVENLSSNICLTVSVVLENPYI